MRWKLQKSDELYHYGVKGQKWGVRRYQNPDGSLTSAGKRRYNVLRNAKTKPMVDEIIRNMTIEDRKKLGMSNPKSEYLTVEEGEWVVKRIMVKDGQKPVGFFDVFSDGQSSNIALAIRSDYQGRGYGSKMVSKGQKWIDNNLEKLGPVQWSARKDNSASIYLAEKYGYVRMKSRDYTEDGHKFISYVKTKDLRKDKQ